MTRRNRRFVALLVVLLALVAGAVQLNRTQLWEDTEIHAGWRVQHHVLVDRCRLLDRDQATRMHGWSDDCAAAFKHSKQKESLAPESRHLVLMLHGMGRSTFIFRDMAAALREAGYDAVAISYPSLTKGIAGHADHLEALLGGLEATDCVSFVTHSLGGLVVREVLNRDGAWRDKVDLGRVVMLAPPNQGSELAVALQPLPPYAWIGGPSAVEIAAGPPFAALPADIEVAIIAGGTTDGRGFNPLLSGNNDGVVTVAETELAAARERMTVNTIHTVIAASPETIGATLKFLASGRLR